MHIFVNLLRQGRRGLLFVLLAFLVVPVLAQDALLVAAGAGYRRPVTELANAFEQSSGIRVEQMYGNMAQVISQVGQSGRVAVVFGDRIFLERSGAIAFDRFIHAGKGRLVLAWPSGAGAIDPAELAAADLRRIALPDTRHAIYGRAAAEFLERSGQQAAVAARLLTVSTVPQVSAYLVSGEVDAGFVNMTDALGVADRIGGYVEIDAALHDPIEIAAGVLSGHATSPLVEAFADFLASPQAREILDRHGL